MSDELRSAAERMDWQQVVLNGGPPCFWVSPRDGLFCGRAKWWVGHDDHHRFVSLADLIQRLTAPSAPLPDLEAELQKTAIEICRRTEYVEYPGLDIAEIIRPLLHRAAGVRADDGEPVTEEWLRSVGFDSLPGSSVLDLRPSEIEWFPANNHGQFRVGKTWLPHIKTRIDVRRLCAALGVPLKEAT